MEIEPQTAVDLGAGWRFEGGNPAYRLGAFNSVRMYDGVFTLEFRPVPGFVAPDTRPVELVVGSTNRVVVRYLKRQNISFGAIPDQGVGGGGELLKAETDSGLPLEFSVVSGPATISGGFVVPTGPGSVVVRVSQRGDEVFAPASVERAFTVTAANPALPVAKFQPSSGVVVSGKRGASYRVDSCDLTVFPWKWTTFYSFTITVGAVLVPDTLPKPEGGKIFRVILLTQP